MNAIWNFYETGCVTQSGQGCFVNPSTLPLATLTLPSVNSIGAVSLYGNQTPVLSGDGGAFSLDFGQGTDCCAELHLSPINLTTFGSVSFYDVSWAEVNGQLLNVSIDYYSFGGGGVGPFGLTGGRIGADGILGSCESGECIVSGYWADPVVVPEPASLSYFIVAALVFWLSRAAMARI